MKNLLQTKIHVNFLRDDSRTGLHNIGTSDSVLILKND